MDDTKGVQMVYEPSAIVRKEVLEAHPQIKDLIEPVFASLDRETLQMLNGKIQVEGMPPRQVARDYLQGEGFLK